MSITKEQADIYADNSWVNHEELLKKVDYYMALKEGQKVDRILDIGVGTGALAKYISKKGERIYGIDICEVMIEKAKERGIPNLELSVGNAKQMLYESEFFDIVILDGILQYNLGNINKIMAEVGRVLKRGGLLVLWEDISCIDKDLIDYFGFVTSFDSRTVFNRETLELILYKYEGIRGETMGLNQSNITQSLAYLSEKDREKALEILIDTTPSFKNRANFYMDPYTQEISMDLNIYVGSGIKNAKEGMYNWGWWDGPKMYQEVNRNVIAQCQRNKLFEIVTVLAPGSIGFNIGGPRIKCGNRNALGFNIDKNANDIVADGSELPFLDNSVDFYISSHTVEHIKDVPKAMREWTRTLKPGGLIGMTIPDKRYFLHSWDADINEYDLAPSEMTSSQMKEILDKIPELEILLFDTNQNIFDFDVLARKRG